MLTQESNPGLPLTQRPPGFIQDRSHRTKHWFTMFTGTSYYHAAQGIGRVFVPGELKGYFNDLTGKVKWAGRVDQEGLPVSLLSNGRSIQFPILLCQKALGHWDLWLMGNEAENREHFLRVAAWLLRTQDSAGGWDTWGPMGQPAAYSYSAMTQGEAISVLTRAHLLTGDAAFAKASQRALTLMQQPVAKGGVSVLEGPDIFLEEFPGARRDTVLNGWMFALFGVYDYLLQFKDEEAQLFFERTRATLIRSLPGFDTGYWSYDSNGTGRLASPFYHRLHISQLEALGRISNEPAVANTRAAWVGYEKSRICKGWAVLRKGIQKTREPRETTIVG